MLIFIKFRENEHRHLLRLTVLSKSLWMVKCYSETPGEEELSDSHRKANKKQTSEASTCISDSVYNREQTRTSVILTWSYVLTVRTFR